MTSGESDPASGAIRPRVSAILPCFEEVDVLEDVVLALSRALRDTTAGWEILLVASAAARDGTPALAARLASSHTHVRRVLQAADDPGYGRAVALGVAAALGPWLLLIDADGQLDPSDLPRLVARIGEADVIVGVRAPRADAPARRLAALLYGRVARWALRLPHVQDLDCAFKLVHTEAVGRRPLRSRTGAVNAELLARARSRGARVVELSVSHRPRRRGRARFELAGGLPRPREAAAVAFDVARLWWGGITSGGFHAGSRDRGDRLRR